MPRVPARKVTKPMSPSSISTPANARSRRTRATLLSVAHDILKNEGFEALTITAVAERAGVTRRSVYLHFPGRPELVGALFDHISGVEGLEESLSTVWAAPDSVAALDRWAGHLATYHSRLLPVDRAVQRVGRDDPDADAHRVRVATEKLANCRRLARWLHREQRLSPRWSTMAAADMLYALVSSDVIEALLVDRRWSQRRLAAQLGLMFRSTFVDHYPERP